MNPGDRVRVRRNVGRDVFGTLDRVDNGVAWVVRDGKRKPGAYSAHRVSPECGPYRTPSPPLALTRAPSYERPELRAVERETPVRSERYLAWIRTQPCAWTGRTPVEASHHPREGHASTALKCSDHRAIPLAPEVHREWHDRGAIGGMSPDQTREWAEEQINEHLSRYVRVLEERGAA